MAARLGNDGGVKPSAYVTLPPAAPDDRPDATPDASGGRKDPVSEAVEIRKQNDAIDEIIIHGGVVHIEQMTNDGWYMGVEASDGSYWQFWFGAKNRKSHVEFRHTEMITAEEEKRRIMAALSKTP